MWADRGRWATASHRRLMVWHWRRWVRLEREAHAARGMDGFEPELDAWEDDASPFGCEMGGELAVILEALQADSGGRPIMAAVGAPLPRRGLA